jgi:GNAT superfamily N-acetyltransferase
MTHAASNGVAKMDLPEQTFTNPAWHALHTHHRHLGAFAGEACRYRADVVPFGAVAAMSPTAMESLRSLMQVAEALWVFGKSVVEIEGLRVERQLPCYQMVLPAEVTPPEPVVEPEICRLSAADAAEMVALTDVAFPGFFRARTHEMGAYFGVRQSGRVVAMAGERLRVDRFCEISGVCTHPDHRGGGLATALIWHVVREHRQQGLTSWLHVGSANRGARELYARLAFGVVREVMLHRVVREA